MDPNAAPLSVRSPEVIALFASYRNRGAAFLEREAVYAIPSPVLADLSSSRLFTREQAQAEKAFALHCTPQSSLGFRHGHAIRYGLLTTHSSHLALGEAESPVLTKADILGLKALRGILDSVRERLLGVAGRLNTLPQFWTETEELRKEYEALPGGERPGWPLRRSFRMPAETPLMSEGRLSPVPDALGSRVESSGMFEGLEHDENPGGDEAAAVGIAFQERLARHLDKWGLSALADWHLPEPDAPLVPNPLTPGSPAEPRHGIHILLPMHYPLRGDDEEFLRRVKEAQRDRAEELGLPPDVASIDQHREFAQILRLGHLELVLRSRWPAKVPRGAVGFLEGAGADYLGISVGRVRLLRARIKNLRAGKPTPPRSPGPKPGRN